MNYLGKNDPKKAFNRYAVAVSSVAAGLGLRFALGNALGSTVPYITFFPAVMWAAWFGGIGPGILTTVLSLLSIYFAIPPFRRLGASSTGIIDSIVFVSVSVFISVLSEALRRARARSEERLRHVTSETARRASAEEALAESKREADRERDLLHITLSSIGDAVITADAKGKVTFLNSVAQQLTGWSQTGAIGRAISDVFVIRTEETGLPLESPAEKAIQEGVVVGVDNHAVLVNREGRNIPIENRASPIRDEHQRVIGVVLVFRDVADRRKFDEALKLSDERLKLALNAGKIGVWDWDIVHNQVEWSDLVHDIHGVERGTFHGGVRDFARLVHPEDRQPINEAIRAALEDDSPYEVEFRVIHPSGELHWVSSTARVFRNEEGKPVRMLGATTDITARKDAERHLRQQWHTFDIALSNTPDFTYIFDLQGRFTYVNCALLSLWQKPLEEALGKNFFELGYPPELAERLQRQIQEVIATKEPLRDQTPFTGPTGETRHYEYIFVPVLTAGDQVASVAGSTRDVTERNRVEEALRKSEERLTFALEAGGGVGTWDWDVPQNRVFCNFQFARLYSVDPERGAKGVLIEEFVEHIYPADRGRVDSSIQQALKQGEDFAEEYRVVQPDGSVRWVYARGRCHLDEGGNPSRFPGVAFDITERKRAEESLRESQDRLRAIFDGTYEYIGLLAPDGRLLEANRASLTFANNAPADVLGLPFWDTPWFTATPGAPEAVREGVARAATGEFVRFEAKIQRPSGECPTFDISFHPVRNERGEVVLIVPEGRDITGLKRAEDDLRRSNEELKRVNRELEEFAYVASHDLQEPLRTVNIYTQLMFRNSGVDAAKASQFAAFIQQGVARMQALIRDLLAFSRVVHTEELEASTADLSTSFREALAVLKNEIEQTSAVVTAEALPTVRGDTSQMAHVFQNLLSNAMKYHNSDAVPEIHVSCEPDGDQWVVSVRDNGIGFDPSYAERIFKLFKRLHKDEYPGTGLGLAICRRIVERFGGRIWAESRPGEGSIFRFALRRVDAAP